LSFWGGDLDLTVYYRGFSAGAYLLDVGDKSLAEKNLGDLFSFLCARNWEKNLGDTGRARTTGEAGSDGVSVRRRAGL